MASARSTSGRCLKCDKKCSSRLQYFLNQISGPPRKNPLICHSDVKRITRAICTCSSTQHQAWQSIRQDAFNKARTDYTSSGVYSNSVDGSNISIHKHFYEFLLQNGLFGNLSSADRLVYIISCKIPGQRPPDILDQICPVNVQSDKHVCHIGSLKENQIGRFIGRGGTGIREAVHGIPVGNVTIEFQQSNSESDVVVVRATYSCRRRHYQVVETGLRTRIARYTEDNLDSTMDTDPPPPEAKKTRRQ